MNLLRYPQIEVCTRSANPLALVPANWPENHAGKGTIPESWDSWKRFWSKS